MDRGLIAKASITINASIATVWNALTDSKIIKQYMFGTDIVSDWKEGSPIVWKGEWQGRRYEDKGVIFKLKPQHLIQYSHYSPLSRLPDTQENYHTVTIELTGDGAQTLVSLSQDNNANQQEREHSEKNWKMMLASLKKLLEKQRDNIARVQASGFKEIKCYTNWKIKPPKNRKAEVLVFVARKD